MIPLAQDDRTETQSGSSPSSLTTTLSTPTGDTSPSLISGGGITGGQIAGIVLGTVAFFALGAAAIFFLLRRKRKPADVPHIEDNSWRTEKEVTQGGPKQELDGREVHVATSGMVDASQQPLAELHEDALVEMEQPVQRVELENQEPESNT
ncbi:hypothetical protein B0T10DRAFT_569790 [Thelonectria olida]|uniref:Uncharacterized protein n=1 Tax=Thelonectria olida TaxID=1576542 RepID=A0A9P8VPE5_9HYPO|nr:hypothetical protein B0T10DRAFT_569790 [Thelonectria olida]